MKTFARLAPLVAASLVLAVAGCQSNKKPAAAPPMMKDPVEVLRTTREDYAVSAKNAKLASVTEFDADSGWLALGGENVTASDFPVDVTVSIIDQDATGTVIGHAKVRQSADGAIYAEYFKGEGRAPRAGDVAVKF